MQKFLFVFWLFIMACNSGTSTKTSEKNVALHQSEKPNGVNENNEAAETESENFRKISSSALLDGKQIPAEVYNHDFANGFIILDTVSCDLNDDSKKDFILITKFHDEDSADLKTNRNLYVLLAGENNEWIVADKNLGTVVQRPSCKQSEVVESCEAYDHTKTSDNRFIVFNGRNSGGSGWTEEIVFEFNAENKQCDFIKYTYHYIDFAEEEKSSRHTILAKEKPGMKLKNFLVEYDW